MLFWLLTMLIGFTKLDVDFIVAKARFQSVLRHHPELFEKVAEGNLVINSNEKNFLYTCATDLNYIPYPSCDGGGNTCLILTGTNKNLLAVRCSHSDYITSANGKFKGKDVLIGSKKDSFGDFYAGIWYIMKTGNNYTFHFLPLVEREVNVFAYGKNIKEFYSKYEVGRKFLRKLTLDNGTYYRGFLWGEILSVEPKKDFIKVYVKRHVEFLKEDSTGITSTAASLEKESVILKLTPTGWKIKGKHEILPYLCVDCEF